MPEITLENVQDELQEESPQEETDAATLQNDETPAIVEEPAPPEAVETSINSDAPEEEPMPVVMKKARGRPTGPPQPKPEAKKRGRPPSESNPEPRKPYEAPIAWDMAAYNQSFINALVQQSQTSKSQRRAQWSSLVKL